MLSFLPLLLLLSCAFAQASQPASSQSALPVVDIQGDLVIQSPTSWSNGHYRINGNVVLKKGGTLSASNCVIEIVGDYSRQHQCLWEGGELETIDTVIGGTVKDGVINHTGFGLYDGQWNAVNTTIRYSYGILFGYQEERMGRLRATNLISGPNSDAVIMCGYSDVVIKDSTFCIALTASANKGGKAVFDLPIDRPVSMVYDSKNVPGAPYRLELVNTKVPMWFLFINQVSMDAPPMEILVKGQPNLIPSLLGDNLQGSVNLPTMWKKKLPHDVTVGNVTWKATDEPLSICGWSLYLSGDKTDFTLTGPTTAYEIMAFGGKVTMKGQRGTYNAITSATTVDAKGHARVIFQNATIGAKAGSGVRGQITAQDDAEVVIENSKFERCLLMTRDRGRITLKDVQQLEGLEQRPDGGPIQFEK